MKTVNRIIHLSLALCGLYVCGLAGCATAPQKSQTGETDSNGGLMEEAGDTVLSGIASRTNPLDETAGLALEATRLVTPIPTQMRDRAKQIEEEEHKKNGDGAVARTSQRFFDHIVGLDIYEFIAGSVIAVLHGVGKFFAWLAGDPHGPPDPGLSRT